MSIFNSDLKSEQILSVLKDVKNRIHFIGILGSGMYPLARLLQGRGYKVSGSDAVAIEDSYNDGSIVITRPKVSLDNGISMAVYSLAIDDRDPEILYARSQGILLVSRAQLLGALMCPYDVRISVSGSHGKSTVTALIDHILATSGKERTTVSGAKLSSGETFVDKGGDIFLAEACEYKDSFLRLCPTHQLITSVELDHTDYFASFEDIRASFLKAAKKARCAVINCDDDGASHIINEMRKNNPKAIITYGRKETADYRICEVEKKGKSTDFTVISDGRQFRLTTTLIGEFNLYNISAAVAMADIMGVDRSAIEKAVGSFCTIDRRMTLISEISGVPVYYDYAHHPSEIRAILTALKEIYGAVTLVFRPHTYSRTKSLWQDFIAELSKADFTILLDIYPAREKSIFGVDSKRLASCIKNAVYANKCEAVNLALSHRSDAIALIGAGDVEDVKNEFIKLGKSMG